MDAMGGAVGVASQSTFLDDRNLITAGGAVRDSVFSSILGQPDGGVFVTAITEDLSTVISTPGVNDALARIAIAISPDAFGDFHVSVGEGTALSDAEGFPVPFDSESVTITVIPEPHSLILMMAAAALCISRRRGW